MVHQSGHMLKIEQIGFVPGSVDVIAIKSGHKGTAGNSVNYSLVLLQPAKSNVV